MEEGGREGKEGGKRGEGGREEKREEGGRDEDSHYCLCY